MKRLFQLSLHAITIVAIAYFCFLSYDTTREIDQLERELEKAQEVHDDHTRFLAELRDDRQKYMSAKSLVSETRQRLLQLVSSFTTVESGEFIRSALEDLTTEHVVVLRQHVSSPIEGVQKVRSRSFWVRVPDETQKLCIQINKITPQKTTVRTSPIPELNSFEFPFTKTIEERFLNLEAGRIYELAYQVTSSDPRKDFSQQILNIQLDGNDILRFGPKLWSQTSLKSSGADITIQTPGMLKANMSIRGDQIQDDIGRKGCWLPLTRTRYSTQTDNDEQAEFEISLSLATSGKILVRKPEKDLFSRHIDLQWSEENNAYLVGRIHDDP